MFYREDEFEDILQTVVLVPYSPGYKLGDFDCGTKDYKQTADIIAYMALSTDSFLLDKEEKTKEGIEIPINSIPALKIGKLAVDYRCKDKPYGSFMLWLALGVLEQHNTKYPVT